MTNIKSCSERNGGGQSWGESIGKNGRCQKVSIMDWVNIGGQLWLGDVCG